jgi:hypothetical protein
MHHHRSGGGSNGPWTKGDTKALSIIVAVLLAGIVTAVFFTR